jgi:hypothetical protein
MIEGTRSYKPRGEPRGSEKNQAPLVDDKDGTKIPDELASKPLETESRHTTMAETAPADAMAHHARKGEDALDRRAWFSSLVPAMGDGLVKLLRASNNLKDDLGLKR